jgi:sporulation protein YlmC with PRC-barrel domain
MLRKTSDLLGYSLHTTDDKELGKIHDFYFDRDDWQVRYLVADIGSWFSGRRVLIDPMALRTPNWEFKTLPVDLTKEQVKSSPDIDLAEPVTRHHESSLRDYYGWPTYWTTPMIAGGGMIAPTPTPVPDTRGRYDLPEEVAVALEQSDDLQSHLYSMRDTQGYTIEATDGTIGHVDDLLVDDQSWEIRYLLIDTGNWLPGRKVLFSPRWVNSVDWSDGRVYVNVSKAQVKESPEYDPAHPLEQPYESELHRHYGYPEYW